MTIEAPSRRRRSTVQTRRSPVDPRDRGRRAMEVVFASGAAGAHRRQGAPARAAAFRQGEVARRPRPCRCGGALRRLSRSGSPRAAGAGRPAGARGVRGDRAGAGRGDRRQSHARRRGQPRRPLDDRFQRGKFAQATERSEAPIPMRSPDGARAADRPGAAAARAKLVDLWRPGSRTGAGRTSTAATSWSRQGRSPKAFAICSTRSTRRRARAT